MKDRLASAFAAVCLALALGAVLLCRSDLRSPGEVRPELHLPAAHCDLGKVPQGVVLRPRFAATNTGGRRLVLFEHSPRCCDNGAQARTIVVPPGATRHVELAVDTTPWVGQLRHVARFTTDDLRRPRVELSVRAVVEASGRATSADQVSEGG